MDLAVYLENILCEDNCKAAKEFALQYRNHDKGRRDDGRVQVPIDVAVEEPRTRVVGKETDGDIVARIADTHDITDYGIDEVVRRIPTAADYPEGVPVQMHRVLCRIVASE